MRTAAGMPSRNSSTHDRCAAGQGRHRGGHSASLPDAADRRGDRARSGQARRRAQDGHRGRLRRALSRQPDHARREDGRGARAMWRGSRSRATREPRQAGALRRNRRRAVQTRRAARRRAHSRVPGRDGARTGRARKGARHGRRRARGARDTHVRRRGRRMIGRTTGPPISITGLGCHVPERVLGNDELSTMVDTNNECILERRIAADGEALTDIALPACRRALEMAGAGAASIDLLIVATVTPDMAFPSCGALLADELGMPDAAAYDLSAGCTGFVYAIAQAHAMLASGLAKRALVVGGDVLSKILDWTDRSTLVLFGDGAGAVVLEVVGEGGFLGFELGADGGG